MIYLSDLETEDELSLWPLLDAIVRGKVKPERDQLGTNPNNTPLKRRWWAYQAHRPELYAKICTSERVLVNAQTGPHLSFAFLPANWVYSHALNVYDIRAYFGFAFMQCRVHELWARMMGSSMKDDLRYTPSDCFATFPFPTNVVEQAPANPQHVDLRSFPLVESTGREYYEFRAALLIRHNEGLTKTYNRFHDRDHDSTEPNQEIVASIQKLRELHAAMDDAVLIAYGWHDLAERATCEFLLDYEEEEDEEEETGGRGRGTRRRKRPWRYRWPDEFRDEVLAKLLELNKERAEEERLAGLAAEEGKPKKTRKPRKMQLPSENKNLF